jgi:predicted 3-demethylubiquinone-9 3-methyltransferase (glyoxalase superfamily)
MQKITPHLWFDKEAKEAINFYTSIFPHSSISNITTIHKVPTPTGDCDIVSFELAGQPFMAINAGPEFKMNPSISLIVNFDPATDKNAIKNLDILWEKLAVGGKVLMPLDKYFFSDRYGWIQDKYGLSWQLIHSKPEDEKRPTIIPSLMFVGDVAGQAEEAINLYLSVFKNSQQGMIARYGKDQAPDKEGTLMFADFMLNGQWFAAMDSAHKHDFTFNEAISLLIPCETQKEIDYYWEKLSAVPKAEQCGWLKDKFGVSWQVWPIVMGEMLKKGTPDQVARVTQAFLNMKKFDIAKLQQAFEGNR